jgi:PTH1 family peptidyl-tRNA hydrolase
MNLIIGLGNPEKDYANTRHNMGFDVINLLSKKYDIEVNKTKFKSLYGDGFIEGKKVILLKPQTFMNLSGESLAEIMKFYKIDVKDILIIYDDIDTEPGKIRIREQGSSGTHNGMKSIISHIGTEKFDRIRIGIGKPEHNDLINYVIGKIKEEDYKVLEEGIKKAADATVCLIKEGTAKAMNKFNKV